MIFMRLLRKIYYSILSVKLFHYFYSNALSLISQCIEKFIKKEKHLIIFGASNGVSYGDNSRFLFEWIIKNKPNYNCVWLTHSKSVQKKLLNENYIVELTWSLKGILKLFKANIGCYTNTLRDLSIDPWFFPCKIKLIALRHGKSVKGVQASLKNFKLSKAEAKSRDHEKKRIVAVLSTSNKISKMTDLSLKVGMGKMFVTGYPRNDSFFLNSPKDKEFVREIVQKDTKKIILYAPSWRNARTPTSFFPFDDFDLKNLITIIEKYKVQILLRPHPNDLLVFPQIEDFLENLADSSRFIEIADTKIVQDIFTVLPFVDCLITDYSATYHDYLLSEKPMWFIPYDYNDFKQQNGFLYDYLDYLPGPHLESFSAFIHELKNLCEEIDTYSQKRQELCDMVHQYKDGNSSKRVYDLITNLEN
jgi:CDP-glycerol glycerophosphotransferase (TagB/SpsB family)